MLGVLNSVHELVDKEHAGAAGLQQVVAFDRAGNGGGIEAGARISDDDDQFSLGVKADATLHLLLRIVLAAVADGVGQGFLQGEVDFHHLFLRPARTGKRLIETGGDSMQPGGIDGNDDVEGAGGAKGDEGVEGGDAFQSDAQFFQVAAQFELGGHLAFRSLERVVLLGGEPARDVIDDAESAQGEAVRSGDGGAGIEADVGSPCTSGLSWKRGSLKASGTEKMPCWWMAWAQKETLRVVYWI